MNKSPKHIAPKKGILNVPVEYIILVGGILLLTIAGVYFASTLTKGNVEICKSGVTAQQFTESKIGGTSPLSLPCERRFVDFYDTQTTIGYNPEKNKPTKVLFNGKRSTIYPKLNDYIVNQVVAEEMRTCWYQFNEGDEIMPNNENMIENDDDV